VLLNLTTSNMLTMEYVPGIKINNITRIEEAGIDRAVLARRSAESYLTQLCRHGFFRKYPVSHPLSLHVVAFARAPRTALNILVMLCLLLHAM
jgi:aarF domain-containing kinase